MKDSKVYVIVFTVAITAFFSFLMSTLNAALAEKKRINNLVSQYRVVLDLLGITPGTASPTPVLSPQEILTLFEQQVRVEYEDSATTTPTKVYAPASGGDVRVFPIKGQGFWDTIHGYLALDRRHQMLVGVAFTQHGETPGLGARIDEPEFRRALAGKSVAATRPDGLYIKFIGKKAADAQRDPGEVDGITGATGTTSAVERLLNEGIRRGLTMPLRQGESSL